jgi:hypothetical protein
MNLEALECAYKEIELQPIVHKGVKRLAMGRNSDPLDIYGI